MNLWDIGQDTRINHAANTAGKAEAKAERVNEELHGMQRQIDHLTLLCQSMWELMREHSDLSDQVLRAKIADVDTRDGKADGKINPQVFPCPACGANCNSTRQACTMCGEDLKSHKPHIFEA